MPFYVTRQGIHWISETIQHAYVEEVLYCWRQEGKGGRQKKYLFIQHWKENIAKEIIDEESQMTKRKLSSLIKEQGTGFQKHSLQQIQHKRNKVNQMFRKQIITQIKQQRIKVNKRNRKIIVKMKIVT